jgi:hypothetical protein
VNKVGSPGLCFISALKADFSKQRKMLQQMPLFETLEDTNVVGSLKI